MSRWWVVGLVISGACSHHEPTPKATNDVAATGSGSAAVAETRSGSAAVADNDPAPCDAAARQAVANSRTDGTGSKDLIKMLESHCIADGWSIAARKCYLLTNSWDEALHCESKLTDHQVKALEAEINARGSVMGHPPPEK